MCREFPLNVICLCLGIITLYFYFPSHQPNSDFLQYWSAWQLLQSGLNPYNPEILFEFQKNHGLTESFPRMFWCPPWGLFFMQPALNSSLENAQLFWIYEICAIYLVSIFFLFRYLSKFSLTSLQRVLLFFFSISLVQFYDLLKTGQISIILLLSSTIFIYFLNRKRIFLAGLALSILSIKPHLFYLFWIYLLWYTVSYKDKKLISGFIFGIALLALLTEIFLPGANKFWLETFAFSERNSVAVARENWLTVNFAGFLKAQFNLSGALLNILIPGISGIILLLILVLRKIPEKLSQSPQAIFILLSPFSLFTAPYGWFYDQIVLLPLMLLVLVGILKMPEGLKKYTLSLLFLICTVGASGFYFIGAKWLHELWWVSLGYAVLVIIMRKFIKNHFLSYG